MLSVSPAAPLDVQLASQSHEWQFESNLAIVMLDAKLYLKDTRVGDFLAIPHFSAETNGSNMFGNAGNWPGRSLDGIPAGGAPQATPFGNNVWESVPWQSIKSPQLDPISINPPGLSPIRVGAGDVGIGPQPIRPPAAIDAGIVPTAPVSEVSTTIKPARSAGAFEESTRPNWLPVAFSPDEQNRLDATTVDKHFERTMATRDPRSRFDLEPTRITCQTFCDPVAAPPSGQEDAAELPTQSVPKPTGKDRGTEQPIERLPRENTNSAIEPAIRDAAILNWESSNAVAISAPVPATRPSQRNTGPRSSSTAARDGQEGEMPADSAVAQFLDDSKYLTAALLAVLAAKSFWSYGGGADAQTVGPTLGLLRKRIVDSG